MRAFARYIRSVQQFVDTYIDEKSKVGKFDFFFGPEALCYTVETYRKFLVSIIYIEE